jgi:hypothetical protein
MWYNFSYPHHACSSSTLCSSATLYSSTQHTHPPPPHLAAAAFHPEQEQVLGARAFPSTVSLPSRAHAGGGDLPVLSMLPPTPPCVAGMVSRIFAVTR